MQTIGAKIQLDGEAQFKAGLSNITQQSKTLAAEMKALTSSFDKNATSQEKARAKMQVLEKQIGTQNKYIDTLNGKYEAQKKKLDEIGAEYEKVAAEQGANSTEAQKLAEQYTKQETALNKTAEQINKAETALNKMTAEMRECEAEAKGLSLEEKFKQAGDKISEAGDKVTAFGDKLANVGKAASIATGAVVAVGKKAVDAFNEVDTGADTIVTKTGASGKALESMQQSMENIATTIPTSFDAAGEAIGEVNTRFGLTGDELEGLSAKFVKFAEINRTDITSSVDSTQKAMAAFGVETKDAGGFLDLLTVQAQRTGISTDAITSSMVTNGAALKEMGMSASGAAVFLADLEVSGTDASAVMTGLKKAVTNAAKEGKSMSDAMADVESKIKGAKTETEAISAASELFGNKAGPALAKAVREGQISFEDLAESTYDFSDSMGAVDDTFENTLDPIDELKLTTNNLKTGLAELANTAMTTLQPAMQKLTELVKTLAERFKNLTPEQQNMVLKIAAIVAAIGPLLTIGGKVVSGVGSLMSVGSKVVTFAGKIPGIFTTVSGAFSKLAPIGTKLMGFFSKVPALIAKVGTVFKTMGAAIMAHPVLAIGAVIVGIVAYLVHLYKTNETFRNKVNAAMDAVKAKLGEVKDFFVTAKNAIVGTVTLLAQYISAKINEIKTFFHKLKETVQTVVNNIKSKFNEMRAGISSAIDTARNKIQTLADKVRAVKDKISSYISQIKSFFSNLKLKIPKPSIPSLPKFEVTWNTKTVLGQTVSVPKIGVSWHDKGGIFDRPTIIGVGERRPEFVGALDDLRKIVREESGGSTINIVVNGAEGQDVRELANIVYNKLNTQLRRERVYA